MMRSRSLAVLTSRVLVATCTLTVGLNSAAPAGAAEDVPTEWIEASGHRVVRLSREAGSASFYFHQNGYSAAGDKLVIATPDGLAAVDLKTRAIEPIVNGR